MDELSLIGISKTFPGEVVALARTDLRVEAGRLLVLLGPSGCGKTTLLRIIAGLEEPSEGRVIIGDADVTRAHPKDRDVAMVFQSYALYPHMTVYDNLAFGLRMRKTPRKSLEEKVTSAAETLDIVHLLQRKPAALSGGQRQRVALGRAMVRDPKVFLLDEPLSNLDAVLRAQMRTELVRMQRKLGRTMVYVTHDQTEAMTMGDQVAVMSEGRIMQIGAPAEVYSRPAGTFVARFIGSPPMNMWDAAVTPDGAVELAGGSAPLQPAPELAAALRTRAGGTVRAGARPEGLLPHRDRPARPSLQAVVEMVESTGSETYLRTSTAVGELVVRSTDAPAPEPGERIFVEVPPASLHVFDPQDGSRLG
jgi:multiple sugar transport system ATP-binding protein